MKTSSQLRKRVKVNKSENTRCLTRYLCSFHRNELAEASQDVIKPRHDTANSPAPLPDNENSLANARETEERDLEILAKMVQEKKQNFLAIQRKREEKDQCQKTRDAIIKQLQEKNANKRVEQDKIKQNAAIANKLVSLVIHLSFC